MQLPDWAEHIGDNRAGMPIISVDTHAAYPAILEEYRALYADAQRLPGEWRTKEGTVRKEWADCLSDLTPDTGDAEVSAYWLEVVYQTAKLDLVVACRGFSGEFRFHDPGKRFRQADHPEGRGPDRAAGGLSGGREAREHYRRLRGFLPA